jgi:hypothetical protein
MDGNQQQAISRAFWITILKCGILHLY